jgi:hypothetical protein
MTPERHFALKLKARAEHSKLQDAVQRLRKLFASSEHPDLCGITHKRVSSTWEWISWHDYLSGDNVLLASFGMSREAEYIAAFDVELKRLRAERKAQEKGAAA